MKLIIDFNSKPPCVSAFSGSVRQIADMLAFPKDQAWESKAQFIADVKEKFVGADIEEVRRISDSEKQGLITHFFE